VNAKVNDAFGKWLNRKYGTHGKVKATRGKLHDYLGMTFDFTQDGKMIVDMSDYIIAMVDDFSNKLKVTDTAPTPAPDDLFAAGDGAKLNKEQQEVFHTFVAKGLLACKRARPDLHTSCALASRVPIRMIGIS
jgi:hypothetical protein